MIDELQKRKGGTSRHKTTRSSRQNVYLRAKRSSEKKHDETKEMT